MIEKMKYAVLKYCIVIVGADHILLNGYDNSNNKVQTQNEIRVFKYINW